MYYFLLYYLIDIMKDYILLIYDLFTFPIGIPRRFISFLLDLWGKWYSNMIPIHDENDWDEDDFFNDNEFEHFPKHEHEYNDYDNNCFDDVHHTLEHNYDCDDHHHNTQCQDNLHYKHESKDNECSKNDSDPDSMLFNLVKNGCEIFLDELRNRELHMTEIKETEEKQRTIHKKYSHKKKNDRLSKIMNMKDVIEKKITNDYLND